MHCDAGLNTARLTNANAAPFVPGGASSDSLQQRASMSSAAAPFVPKSSTDSPRGATPPYLVLSFLLSHQQLCPSSGTECYCLLQILR